MASGLATPYPGLPRADISQLWGLLPGAVQYKLGVLGAGWPKQPDVLYSLLADLTTEEDWSSFLEQLGYEESQRSSGRKDFETLRNNLTIVNLLCHLSLEQPMSGLEMLSQKYEGILQNLFKDI